MFFSPLEQFDYSLLFSFMSPYSVYLNLDIVDIDSFVFSNGFFLMVLIAMLFSYVYVFININLLSFNFFFAFFDAIYSFILEMLIQQAGLNSVEYLPQIYYTFLFILFCNLLGMLPFGFTLTAHISLTFYIALSFNLGFIFLGFYKSGLKFLDLFVPSGTPKALLPLIVVIEVVSYLIRTLSLSVRLFANMMAGHCLLYVISSFVFSILNSMGLLAIFPIIVVYLAIFILEFSIAVLQAYVFCILLCIYLNDSLHPSH